MLPQRALGTQQQAVGSTEAEVFVIERALHTTTGISTVWHSSFLPSGYGRGSGQGHPQLCQPRGDPGLGDHPALHPTGVWLGRCRSAARCWCFCRMSLSSTRQVLGGRGLCPPAWAVPACCLAAEWGTPFPAFLLPGGTEPQPPFPKQPLDWEEDVQLYSWFLDRKVRWWDKGTWDCATPQQSLPGDTVGNRLASSPHKRLKCGRGPRHPPHPTLALWLRVAPVPTLPTPPQEELRASHTAYVQQHPELWALLADFLQALLLHQPRDPVSFAAQFFAPFARQQPPGTRFASARAASPLPSSPPHHPPANEE